MVLTESRVESLRAEFPALKKLVEGKPAVFFDGPAGTQVPQCVIHAIRAYLVEHNANHGGVFATSIESDRLLDQAHRATADLLGAPDPQTVSFGGNMTTLTFALSRALARHWRPGDEIVLSRLEHDANFSPWVLAAEDRGATVRYIDFDPNDCTLNIDQYSQAITDRTRLVAVACASNAVGTINPVKQICRWARDAGAISFLDAVHYAPHASMDVAAWDCDFLVCSAYKFFGPHVGIMYGRRELLESIQPYKLRPAPDDLPGRWMTGTQNHEGIAGTMAAIDYLARVGDDGQHAGESRRAALVRSFDEIRSYEHRLLVRLLNGLGQNRCLKVWGITDTSRLDQRLPTVSITHRDRSPREVAEALAAAGIFVWHGNYYALPVTEKLGVEPDGMVRIGLCHYNTAAEVDRLLESLDQLNRR
jgi:cysteine desulfurase family protein (TIGR01976 family)